jgi:hypothetical protein
MIRKSGHRFSERIMLKQKKVERDDDSKKSHPALTARSALPSRVFRWAMATHSFMLRERIEFAASGREITVKG